MFKPLDLQTMIPRSMDIQRLQQVHNTRPAIEQQQFSREMNQVHQEMQKRVAAPVTSASGQKIREDVPNGSGRQPNLRYRRFYKKTKLETEAAEEEKREENGPGRHIDIKI